MESYYLGNLLPIGLINGTNLNHDPDGERVVKAPQFSTGKMLYKKEGAAGGVRPGKGKRDFYKDLTWKPG